MLQYLSTLTSLGVKPKYNPYIQSAQMCGSCHTILLPVLDSPHTDEKSVEQATYPEWLNSQYRNEYGSVGATPKSCQDCHMPTGYTNTPDNVSVPRIQTRMAIVQDLTLPQTEHLATPDQLNVRFRNEGYRRHELLGTNGFLLQMFLQPANKDGNNEVLGTRLKDYMTGFTTDLSNAVDNVVEQAQYSTASLAITTFDVKDNKLIVEVTVSNQAGHRFPSGVGFRRSQSNPIRSSGQVQIYEELVQNADHQFTTSFTRRDFEIKDNRLLPAGWSFNGPPDLKIPEPFLEATRPKGTAKDDPVYLAGRGQSIVRYEIPLPPGANASNVNATVSMYSQTIPPYFLKDRYLTGTPATARLRHLATTLGTLADTDFANWKLLIASAKR